jgi:CBS domain-containing protein
MGYGPVYRYLAGKADWAAAGWEREGKLEAGPFLAEVARHDVPTCRPDETVADVRARADAAGWDRCVVVGDGGVVLGLLSGQRLGADARLRADLVMEPGPSTFRGSVPVAEMAEYMRKNNVQSALVTTSDGVLAGVVDRRSVEQAADGRASH